MTYYDEVKRTKVDFRCMQLTTQLSVSVKLPNSSVMFFLQNKDTISTQYNSILVVRKLHQETKLQTFPAEVCTYRCYIFIQSSLLSQTVQLL